MLEKIGFDNKVMTRHSQIQQGCIPKYQLKDMYEFDSYH